MAKRDKKIPLNGNRLLGLITDESTNKIFCGKMSFSSIIQGLIMINFRPRVVQKCNYFLKTNHCKYVALAYISGVTHKIQKCLKLHNINIVDKP